MRTTETLDTEPWYRQFWPWALISLPALTVVACMITIVIAIKSDDGLVADDYYKEGLAINQSFAKDDRAAELGLGADILFNPDSNAVEVRINNAIEDEQLLLTLTHTTIAGNDRDNIALKRVSGNIFRGELNPLAAGKWKVQVTPVNKEWRLSGKMDASSFHFRLPG